MSKFVAQLDAAKKQLSKQQLKAKIIAAKKKFLDLIQYEQYVGEVYSLGYETASVMIHDHHRREVGGIPSLSFLIATRIPRTRLDPEQNAGLENFDYKQEDSSIILLRVMDAARLPSDDEAMRIRVQSAQSISGEPDVHWDSTQAMDSKTYHVLSFAGVQCRVIGTFYLDNVDGNPVPQLKFGSDISNYYPNQGLKVFKPNEAALETIVNYRTNESDYASKPVNIGHIRYASTNRNFQGVADVPFDINPADFLDQKTALFGMTRTGKSNTTKVILQSVFALRFSPEKPERIGQIVFDPNGEYANENVQDENLQRNPSAIKNVWGINPLGKKDDVVTYGISGHPNDPDRKLMLINFYDGAMLQIGKNMIDTLLEADNSKYIKNFRQVSLEPPRKNDYDEDKQYQGAIVRYKRRVLFYQALLKKAGFKVPPNLKPVMRHGFNSLFSQTILKAMAEVELEKKDKKKESQIRRAASILSKSSPKSSPSWDAIASAAEGLFYFIRTEAYEKFDEDYIKDSSSGESWADGDLIRILEMFTFRKGANMIGEMRNQHTEKTDTDFAQDIYQDLQEGKLVVVDQSSGDPEVNEAAAKRIMRQIFAGHQSLFRNGKYPPHILVYVEEAHNLLPHGTDIDLKDIWVRTAKEGAKYHIGMVYITQEVSSIQRNILKNTANWFIGHLNNTDETKELRKFYDFADFEGSILRAQDKGFLRVKTMSNPFVVPVQVKRFVIE